MRSRMWASVQSNKLYKSVGVKTIFLLQRILTPTDLYSLFRLCGVGSRLA